MNNATPKEPIIKRAKVKGTGLPIDGHTLTFGFWAYDGHKQPHLLDWEKDADEAVMKTMHQTDELYCKMPLECERLQGFPDGWTDIGDWVDEKGKTRKTTDAARYKALGNSIAIPPWKWVLKRLCANYERDATMASLFDGIGGFPLIWERLNGAGTCIWASEIEEFPIAVTKKHFQGATT